MKMQTKGRILTDALGLVKGRGQASLYALLRKASQHSDTKASFPSYCQRTLSFHVSVAVVLVRPFPDSRRANGRCFGLTT